MRRFVQKIDRRLYVAALLAALAAGAALRAQTIPADVSPVLAARLDQYFERERERLKIPGLSVAVAMTGAVRYEKAFGLADVELNVPATTATRFRTASLAKPITGTAVMQLVEKGAIDLDAPIQRYCAAFPTKPWPITVRHVLSHQAGIRHYTKPRESVGTEHFFTITEALRLFKDDPLLHQPGTKYHYSTYAYNVLACAVETVSKMSYPEYLRRHIFEPASMSKTTVDDVYLIIPDRSRGYMLLTENDYRGLPEAARAIARPNQIYNAPLHDTSMKMAGGGLLTTVSDYVRFVMAVREGRLVSPKTVTAMWTDQKTSDGKGTDYGLGWGIRETGGKVTGVSHGGNQAGASGGFRLNTADGAMIIVLTNLEDADISGLLKGATAVITEKRS